MTDRLILIGYGYSVYTRAVRMALLAKDVLYEYREVDPFDPGQVGTIPHPFGRVPVLEHGSFRLYETQAILDYVDRLWPDPSLTPDGPQAAARMRQVMSMTDAYVYWPLVRKVVSEALFRPMDGEGPDQAAIDAGLKEAKPVLKALNAIASEGLVLNGKALTQADCLLWPMLDYFNQVPAGAALIAAQSDLSRWVTHMSAHPVAHSTAPDLKGVQQ